ncbi:MAG: tRNA (guanine-N1)-methyltransferase [Bacteroidetes bacterium MedPE-SWsnd-G2]|nr:MAG: tRNA (guanine-N1)-methyltransferase [Bacteroidetes bacterium MedPE-SWsnd-G2]
MKLFKIFLILVLALVPFSNFAQEETENSKLSLDSGSINDQFEYLYQKSNNYQEYKVVKKSWIIKLKSHTIDSLNAVHKSLSETQSVVEKQDKEITDLKNTLNTTQSNLDKTIEEKDNMSLLGLALSKPNYNMVMFGIILALIVLLALFVYKYNNSNAVTKQAKLALEETEQEFEEHRRIALEREQKVRRQLQDELNKQKS